MTDLSKLSIDELLGLAEAAETEVDARREKSKTFGVDEIGAFEDLGPLPDEDVEDEEYAGRGKHYIEWLAQMLRGEDPLVTLGDIQLAIPRSRRNATVCVEKIESYGKDLSWVAPYLGYPDSDSWDGWERLKQDVEKLPDEGWYVEYLEG